MGVRTINPGEADAPTLLADDAGQPEKVGFVADISAALAAAAPAAAVILKSDRVVAGLPARRPAPPVEVDRVSLLWPAGGGREVAESLVEAGRTQAVCIGVDHHS